MIVSEDSNDFAESLKRASQKANKRDKKRFAKNKEVWGKCAKCGVDLHIADESYDYRKRTYCAKCKPKKAKKLLVVPGVFAFNDVLHELDGILKEKGITNEPNPKKKDKKHSQ